jgi:hypothetical protein
MVTVVFVRAVYVWTPFVMVNVCEKAARGMVRRVARNLS